MRRYTAFLFLLVICFASCTFNKQFYSPDKFDPRTKSITITNKEDTFLLRFSGMDHKAAFTDKNNNPRDFGFSMETDVFNSADGHKLYGWFLKPDGQASSKITLLFLHGNAGNVFSQLPCAVPLVKEGFQVFIFDYSGYGFSQGKPTRSDVLVDACSALDYIRSRADVKGTKVVVYGQSIGGLIASALAVKKENAIDGLVLEGAPSSHKEIAAHEYKTIGLLAKLIIRDEYSAVKSVRKFHKPLLVIQSKEDETIPYFMGPEIYTHANEPKSFFKINGAHMNGPILFADSIANKIRGLVTQ